MTELDGGVYQMSELRYGKYFVREKTAPDGFVLDEGVYGVSIEENGKTYTVENKAGIGFINAAQKGNLKIVKTSSDGKLEGFSFRVTGTNYDQTFKTDKNGEIFIEGLRIGELNGKEICSQRLRFTAMLPSRPLMPTSISWWRASRNLSARL